MKNSALIKGTAAIAVGAALLLGGGGTLASWNASTTQNPGTVVAGDLDVVAGTGVWTDRAGHAVNISTYKVVPGDKLTYTQVLDVTLTGDKMAAEVAAEGATPDNGFTEANVAVTDPVLTVGETGLGVEVTNPLRTSQKVTAKITFEFKWATADRDDVTAEYDFNEVSFALNQITQTGLS
ncbi:alternate-type signal peptide domain-containing protein [uncultured Arthrobacter sp.]|uniref:alternate-type signal peptide domain-containing protein n=1 Tax=uncultured Arthrobacter sp. TaxID=114050 RepID=UPI0028D2803C|nr:alternate-type signal peptide domain-containing protein [uncultured Arthrobacter sp.]